MYQIIKEWFHIIHKNITSIKFNSYCPVKLSKAGKQQKWRSSGHELSMQNFLSFLFLILHKTFLEQKISKSFQPEVDSRHEELISKRVNVGEVLTSESRIVKW